MTWLLTLYVLVWPVAVLATLFVIVRGFIRELRAAKRENRPII